MEEVDILHPLATIECKQCSSLPVAMRKCQAVYHNGTVYVTHLSRRDKYRIYDYSIAKNIWNIIPTDAWRFALANYKSEVNLVVKTQNKGETLDIFPLTGGREITHDATTLPADCMTAMGNSDMLVVADDSLKVVLNGMNEEKFMLPELDSSESSDTGISFERSDVYFSIAFHNDHLFLKPLGSSRHLNHAVFCAPLNLIKPNQPIGHNQKVSSQLVDDGSRKRPQPPNEPGNENANKKARLELSKLPNETSESITNLPCNDQEKLEWEKLEPLPAPQTYDWEPSNLAVFGKRLVTVVPAKGFADVGMNIVAYSPTTKSWLEVADTGDVDSVRYLRETNIVSLDTNQLMLIGGSTGGSSMRNVYQLSLTVAPYDPNSFITMRALYKLQAGERSIKVLTRLEPKLHDFREKAQINELLAYRYDSKCPIVDIYINSWLDDPECALPPTWENFLNVLKDIELGDIVEEIKAYLSPGPPIPPAPTVEGEVEVTVTASKDNDKVSLEGMAEQQEKTESESRLSESMTQSEYSKFQTEVSALQETVKELAEKIKQLESRLKSHDEHYRVKFAAVYEGYSAHNESGSVLHDMNVSAFRTESSGSTNRRGIEGSWCEDYSDGIYSEPSLNDFRHEVATKIPEQWKEVGYWLGLKHEELEGIKKEKDTDKERFTEVFVLWRKQGGFGGVSDYKWIKLLEVLKKIKEYRLENELRQRLTPKASNHNAIVPFNNT